MRVSGVGDSTGTSLSIAIGGVLRNLDNGTTSTSVAIAENAKKYKSRNFKMTHQVTCNVAYVLLKVYSIFLFSGRTDIMRENNNHLFGRRGLVGQIIIA